MWNNSELSCLVGTLVWFFFRVLDMTRCHKFPCADESLVLRSWFWLQWNTTLTNFQRSKAGIPSIRRPACREIISASVEQWETYVCFLQNQLNGTNVRLPKCTRVRPLLSLQGLPQNQNLEIIPICILVLCFPHNNIVWIHWCDECKISDALNACRVLSSILWWHGQVCLLTTKYQVYQFEQSTGIWEQFERILLTLLQQIKFLLLWIDGRQYTELRLSVIVEFVY